MIKFLLQRPISVFMVFLAFVIVGIITYKTLPVSLLPDIAIPEITVQITDDDMSARELENTVVKPIRRQLMQTGNLRDIHSETRNGSSILRMKFEYGTNTDLAFIEVNEKMDAAMNNLPRHFRRPRVIKASATDIPVFYLNLSLKEDQAYKTTNEDKFLDLSDFAENIVKRRIEQLPQVAMADLTGRMHRHVEIVPDMQILKSASITLRDIENALKSNNIEPGSMLVRDGYYEYNIKFSSLLRNTEDIKNIYLQKNGRLFQLKDLAKVSLVRQAETGLSLINGKRGISIGIIKQADDTMESLKNSLHATLQDLKTNYPEIEFSINRNQTELLDYTISNLKQNLSLGFVLVFIVALLFLGDAKSPLVIGISMLVSLITSFVFFYLFGQSINIISLSGLILALGMMIDSSIIVTDIITQYHRQGYPLIVSCIKGTNEVITPILSSTFTTIAVFLPLVFMSGIAGAIFFAQAFAVSVGLLVSYFTGIMLLPVLYQWIYGMKLKPNRLGTFFAKTKQFLDHWSNLLYDKGIDFIFRHKLATVLFVALSIPFCIIMFRQMPKSTMPHIEHTETLVKLDWNENIHVDENKKRVLQLMQTCDSFACDHAAYIGHRQYLLDKENDLSPSEAQLYFKSQNSSELKQLQNHISQWIQVHYPQTLLSFSPPKNIFEKIFDRSEADLVVQLYPTRRDETPEVSSIRKLENDLLSSTRTKAESVPFEQELTLHIDKEKLLLYNVEYSEVYQTLKTAFRENKVATLRSFQEYLPISLLGKKQSIEEVLHNTLIPSQKRKEQEDAALIPLHALVRLHRGEGLKTIIAGKDGEYIPLKYYEVKKTEQLIQEVESTLQKDETWDCSFAGAFFSNQKMLGELVIVLLVSILLMYFILSSQFESFLQPLIVLIEIPIDIAWALLILWLSGNTLNLMSAIGLIVTSGIIINDSILKIDMINELRKTGRPLMEAIHTAGLKRLRAIIMTSLTTIFAMVPLLFSFDLGSELQKPLAIAMIATMLVGIFVSLFVVPLVYWIIYHRDRKSVE